MNPVSPTRAQFIDQVLTSSFAGETAKRFAFVDGEVGAVYTRSRRASHGLGQPVILLVATFPPLLTSGGLHDFGIDYYEYPVASAQEATALLAQFDQHQAELFRASCRAAS